MKNMLRLAFVMLKGNAAFGIFGDNSKKKRKLSRAIGVVLFAFLAVYFLAITTAASYGFYSMMPPQLQPLMIGLFLSMGVALVFVFGIMTVISVFYFSSDVDKLLPLPVRAHEIIGAKLLVTLIYEYLFIAVIVAPALIVYGVMSGAGVLYFIYALIVMLVLPIVPLCMASVLAMLIMRFTKFARNKDRFNLFAGMLAMVIALGFSFSTQSLASLNGANLAALLSKSAADLAQISSAAFPGTSLAAAALADATTWLAAGQVGLVILIAAAFLAVTMFLSKLIYFQGAIGMSSSASNHRRMSAREMTEAGASRPAFWTYVMKDLRILVRTPIFFLNNVMMNFLFPLFFLIPLLGGKQDGEMSQLLDVLKSAFSDGGQTAPLALAIIFAAACFISGVNGIAESALSREGKQFYIMKILPMSYNRQIWAKLMAGILMSACGAILLTVMIIILMQPPLWFVALVVAVMPGAILITNLSGIIFELYWPKLNWDNEQKAVKQNMNVLYGIALSLVFAALVVAPIILLSIPLLPAALLAIGGPLLIALVLALVIRQIGPRLILTIDA